MPHDRGRGPPERERPAGQGRVASLENKHNGNGQRHSTSVARLQHWPPRPRSLTTIRSDIERCLASQRPNLMGQVMGSAIPGSAWYCSALAYGQLFCRLTATAGGLFVTEDGQAGIQANYLGFPLRFSAKLPDIATTLAGKPMLYFGDLSMSSLIVERRQTIVAISRQRALENDQILVRGTRRSDIINHSVGDAATRGPVAALLGGA
jgi:hypothetical protein